MNSKEIPLVWFLLRFGVAIPFLFASISAFINPTDWLSFFPHFMRALNMDHMLVITWGGTEVIIGIWLLFGYYIFLPSLAAAGLMLGIFIFDFKDIDIVFRNFCILCTALALVVISNPFYNFSLRHGRKTAEETQTKI